jgi:hypothetical protein
VQNVDRGDANRRRVFCAHCTLCVVTTANAIDRRQAAIRDRRVGVGGGDHYEIVVVVDFGRGNGDTTVEVADHGEDFGVSDDLLCIRNADFGGRLVVERYELDFKTHLFQRATELFDREFGTVTQPRTQDGLAARQRALRGNLDDDGVLRLNHTHAQGGNDERDNK